jgi:CheY-like chemotaxis protein
LAGTDHGTPRPVHEEDRRHLEFLRGGDLVIHDAQYTLAEYDAGPGGKRGWGHTAIEQAIDFAALAGVERLALFHHDPLRTDDALDQLVLDARARPLAQRAGLEVFGAAEGTIFELSGGERPHAPGVDGGDVDGAVDLAAAGEQTAETVLVADDDADILALLAEVLEPEGLHVLLAADGEAALNLARAAKPALLLLDWQMPGRDGLDVLRALRGSEDEALRRMPVIMLTARTGSEDTAAGFEAGATDYLTKPFTPAHVRSRVREWLLRMRKARASAPQVAQPT